MEAADSVALRIHDRGKCIVDTAVARVDYQRVGPVLSGVIGLGQLVLNAHLEARAAGGPASLSVIHSLNSSSVTG